MKKDRINEIIKEAINNVLNEGIDFSYKDMTVSYNPSHEENVDTSVENNPTYVDDIYPNVRVWSIFKRKKGNYADGNPLIYAMKGENRWHFRSNEDKLAIENQIDKIATKFASLYPIGVTVLIPSDNELNQYIARVVMSKSRNAKLLEGVICKLTVQEVDRIVLAANSEFRKHYGDNVEEAFKMLHTFFDEMIEKKNGKYSKHLVYDDEMRDVINVTLKLSEDKFAEFANVINGENILIIDDTIRRGQSIQETCKILLDSYAPESITVLTLMSRLS